MIHSLFLLLCTLCCLIQAGTSATTTCNGVLTGVFDDVVVPGPTCTLVDSLVRGSVSITGGDFVTQGNNTFLGNIAVSSAGGTVNLAGIVQVNGDVSVMNSSGVSLTVGPDAVLMSLILKNSGPVSLLGRVGNVQCTECGSLSLNGATISPGGLFLDRASGGLTVCSANIAGAVTVVSSTGKLCVAESPTCGSSMIAGTIFVSGGTGDIELRGTVLSAGDFLVQERTGNVDVASARVGDVSVTQHVGSVTLTSVETESDATYLEIDGSVTLDQTTFVGDASISFNTGPVSITGSSFIVDRTLFVGDVSITSNLGPVLVSGSSFSLEDVLISNNAGPVTVTDNANLTLVVTQNQDVTIRGNDIIDASVTNNGNGTLIENNRFEVLRCSANDPPPVGVGNTVTELADGQCAGF